MRTWMLIPLLVACNGPADDPATDDADDTDDTTPATDDTDEADDTIPATDDTDDTTPPADDTDPPITPYDFTGTWTTVSDAFGPAAQPGAPCNPVGGDTPWGITALVWAPGQPVRVTLTGFQIGYTCTVAERIDGRDLTCAPDSGWYTNHGAYDLLYDYPMTASLNDDGTGSFTRRVETTCDRDCTGVQVCAWQDEIFQVAK